MLRRLAPLALLFAVACASTAPARRMSEPTQPAPAVQPTAPGRSALAEQLGRAGHVDAPTAAAIEQALGEADVARREGAGAMLTYQAEGCALVLIFAADARNEMRLREAQALPRREGERALALDACAAAAEQRRR